MPDTLPLARPYHMRNQVQTYDWGTRDADAYIPRLLSIDPEPGVPYAELWLGVHPKAPSTIELPDGATVGLDVWVAAHPIAALGQVVLERFGGLPFLLKVLSAGEALSIQAHPTKAQAEVLHAADPAHYPDDNHKPEIAIALDGLAALMGLKPFADLAATLTRYPEIAAFVGEAVATRVSDVVRLVGAPGLPGTDESCLARALFSALIVNAAADPTALSAAVDALAARLVAQSGRLDEVERRFLDLRGHYGSSDVGLFASFLFNNAHLDAGEALYTTAGVPHAYLKGNIIECMANSDNVVRVGLTPKFKDARTLLEIMDTTPMTPHVLDGDPATDQSGITRWIYTTPAAEFEMRRWALPQGASHTIDKGEVPAVLLVVEGEVTVTSPAGQTTYGRGDSAFLPACLRTYGLHATADADIYQAAVPVTTEDRGSPVI
ncbi:MAG: mannose-6-phosphate isomerase, class I [Anaerolineae bacterium]|nr:mannose-6-phosphate isomerase, class I [Anaerolineae bacterium]